MSADGEKIQRSCRQVYLMAEIMTLLGAREVGEEICKEHNVEIGVGSVDGRKVLRLHIVRQSGLKSHTIDYTYLKVSWSPHSSFDMVDFGPESLIAQFQFEKLLTQGLLLHHDTTSP